MSVYDPVRDARRVVLKTAAWAAPCAVVAAGALDFGGVIAGVALWSSVMLVAGWHYLAESRRMTTRVNVAGALALCGVPFAILLYMISGMGWLALGSLGVITVLAAITLLLDDGPGSGLDMQD
jgi:hypothetical protein